jgi:hypothetical protein
MKWFLSRFDLPSGPDALEQITESLKHGLSSSTGLPFSRRKVKNILCKVYQNRTENTADSRFCNLVFPGQTIYSSCKGDGLRVSFPNETGLGDILVNNCLVTRWAFGNTLLTVNDMIGKLGMPNKSVPTPKEADNWLVPDVLMCSRAKTEVEFDIGHKVEVTCAPFFKCQFQNVSSKLCGSH